MPRTPYVVVPVILLVAAVGEPPLSILLAFMAGVMLPFIGRSNRGGGNEIDRRPK